MSFDIRTMGGWTWLRAPCARLFASVAVIAGLGLFMYIALGTGLVTHVAGDEPLNYALADTRFRTFNFHDQAALRFGSSYAADDARVYADQRGQKLFIPIRPYKGELLSTPNLPAVTSNGFYLYLRSANLAGQWDKRAPGLFQDVAPEVTLSEMVDYVFSMRERMNLVYQSGGSELLYSGGGVGDSGP